MKQVGGTHYEEMSIQPWDAMKAWMTREQYVGYQLGTALAYLARFNAMAPGKGGLQDVRKAIHTLAELLAYDEAKPLGAAASTYEEAVVAVRQKGRPL